MRYFQGLLVAGVVVAFVAGCSKQNASAGKGDARDARPDIQYPCPPGPDDAKNAPKTAAPKVVKESDARPDMPVPCPPLPDQANETPTAATPAEETKQAEAPDLTRIKLDVKNHTVTVDGHLCIREGILDYFAVIPGPESHEYESVLALNCKAAVLHADLLAIGAVPGPAQYTIDEMKKNLPKDGRKIPDHTGTALTITVQWEQDGKTVSVPATDFLLNRETKKQQKGGEWIFTGSYFYKDPDTGKDLYMGDIDMALIAVNDMPSAVIAFSDYVGNPYNGPDAGFEVYTKALPPQNTPLKIIIGLAKPETK